ncbi:WD repeat-containing protein 81 [Elysia marginata]|uniref:WD repeat-containing protein 81 n=1 Tax=Elysia marginata TaxID=1093978 RepID=A0AAV4F2Y5_9GAST|nr:WD repeat-containing protein 81 [Elysia marginata]
MYDRTEETAKKICSTLKIPPKNCQQLSADRAVCLVNNDWIKSLHRGRINSLSGHDGLEIFKVQRFLSRSCEEVPSPWVRISVKAISKSDEIYEGLPRACLQKQWACGSLYEFMSHVCKENLSNLWIQAHNTLTNAKLNQSPHDTNLSFTELIRKYLYRLNPGVYIKLSTSSKEGEQQSCKGTGIRSNSVVDNTEKFYPGGNSKSSRVIPNRTSSFYTTADANMCHGLVPIDFVIETDECFFLVQPYFHYSLRDSVMFSPTILETSYAKSLFIVYQLLHTMHSLHNIGLCMGDLRLTDILMDKNMWLHITSPRLSVLRSKNSDLNSPGADSGSMYLTANSPDGIPPSNSFLYNSAQSSRQQVCDNLTNNERILQAATDFMKAEKFKNYEIAMLDQIVSAWVHRDINNFQYLMILNHLAGRKMGDPNNHPVLPWVLDFSAPDSGYRDLSKSKFRLNKGDGQLDFTYSGMAEVADEGGHVPHHVSDILSDITYYVYKARRTPKSILCAHVRSNWVPHEYPLSMQRLQEWTPDECIPEFFIDPTIFNSIHEDLADLEIPPWSKNTVDFVIQHLAALESDHVSKNLHYWIDLTFGCKLSGTEAIKAKNVHLHLVDCHKHLTSHGIVQLFQEPHPPRVPSSHSQIMLPRVLRGLLTSQRHPVGFPDPEASQHGGEMSVDNSEAERVLQCPIYMPKSYNPLEDLERCEALLGFKGKVLHSSLGHNTVKRTEPIQYQDEGVAEDMVTLLCLVCEMCLDSRLRMQDTSPTLWTRVKMIRRAGAPNFSNIQRPFQKFVTDMFDSLVVGLDKKFSFSPIFPDGSPTPNPALLIQTYSDLIPFPPYFGELYKCLNQIQGKSQEVDRLRRSMVPLHEKLVKIKQLEREKVPIMEAFLWNQQDYLGAEGMGLVLPYIQDLLRNEYTTVQAAWALFDVTTKELGPVESSKQFLPVLTALFSGEVSTAKHIKLYHRSFLIQLIVRFGLKTFLSYFSTLLVEAVAGYKDFTINSRFYPEELLEELGPVEDLMESSPKHESKVASTDSDTSDQKGKLLPGVVLTTKEVKETNIKHQAHPDSREAAEEDGDLNDTIVDGSHILLEDLRDGLNNDIEEEEEEDEGDEDDDNDSHSSDEVVAALYNFDKRKSSGKDRDSLVSGSVSSADQHSIHSISMLIQENRGDSPKTLGSVEGDTADSYPEDVSGLGRSRNSRSSIVSKNSTQSDDSEVQVSSKAKADSSQAKGIDEMEGSPISFSAKSQDKDEQNERASLAKDMKDQKDVSEKVQVCVTVSEEKSNTGEEDSNGENNSSSTVSEDQSNEQQTERPRASSDMVRSETEDLMLSLSANASSCASGEFGGDTGEVGSAGAILNIRDIAADSVKWLCHKLGPALASKFLTRNLVRMIALCYLGQEQMQLIDRNEDTTIKTSRLVAGDKNSKKVLECIAFATVLYGEQVVLIQCMPIIIDMIVLAQKRLTIRSEAGVVAAIVLLTFVIPYLSDTCLMNIIEESVIQNCINPVLELVGNAKVCFPGGALSRFVLCHKLIDLLYTLGLRLGLEMTRKFLTPSMEMLFQTFSKVHSPSTASAKGDPKVVPSRPVDCLKSHQEEKFSPSSDDTYLNIKLDQFTHQYTIGSPIDLNAKSPPRSLLPKIHSLSTLGLVDDKDEYVEPKSPSVSAEKGTQELLAVFSPELAEACYIPLCRIFGSIHMEKQLPNEDLIRQLCAQHDTEYDVLSSDETGSNSNIDSASHETLISPETEKDALYLASSATNISGGNIGKNVAIVGNRIQLHDSTSPTKHSQTDPGDFGRGYRHSGLLKIGLDDLRSADMDQNKSRHLRGNWLAYWERELGLHERDTMFNFMQIELQTYTGHTSSIRSLYTMDTENCFISASKDKTVRLWSIDSQGEGLTKQRCQFCYSRHKKSVFSVAYVESCRLVASCDSTVHIWDPYTGMSINQLESTRYSPVVAVTALPAPSRLVAMATTDTTLRFLDMRTAKYVHEFRCALNNTSQIRCVAVSPDNRWIAAGFSTGSIYVLDVNSGLLLHHWKAHDGEIVQLKAYGESRLLSSALDQTVRLWVVETGVECVPVKSQTEPAHCLAVYRDQLLTGTTANRISVYASATDSTAFASSKLRSASFKGVLTCMSVLPLNKALLLGADNGTIRLMA